MTSPFDAPDWRKLDQTARDLSFNNAAAVPGSADMVAGWEERSAALRAAHPALLNIAYGPRERNKIDIIKAGENAPTLVFIHGGYWQARSKDTFTFFSTGLLAHGINVAHMGYTLAPDATLDEMVAEIHAGLDHLAGVLPSLVADTSKVVLSGWSAGGHLASMALGHSLVTAGLAISGIYDLEPIRHVYVNDKLGLDEDGVARNSPLRHASGPMKPLTLVAGSAELPLMRKQTARFASHRAMQALPVHYEEIPGANHFTIMDALAAPNGRLTRLVLNLL